MQHINKLTIFLFTLLFFGNIKSYSQKLSKKPNWVVDTKESIHSSPVIDSNTAYFGSGDSNFYAVNLKTGKTLWKYKTKGTITCTPTIYNKRVIFYSEDKKVYALNKYTGKKIWITQGWRGSNGKYKGRVIVKNNIVAVGNKDGKLYVFHVDAPGISGCEYKTNEPIWSTPVILGDTIIFGGHDHKIHSINSSCKKIWEKELPGIIATEIVEDNNKIYFGSYDNNIYSLDVKNGNILWSYKTNSIITSAPLIIDNTLNIGSFDRNFYQLDIISGKLIWKVDLKGKVSSKPAFKNNIIWTGTFNEELVGIDFKTGKIKITKSIEGKISSTPAINNNQILIGTWKGKMYSFKIK